jgi:hypothetical protein
MGTLRSEMVTIALPYLGPDVAHASGSPRVEVPGKVLGGEVFLADSAAVGVNRPDGTVVLRLGSGRMGSSICLVPSSGAVVAVWDRRAEGEARGPQWVERFVNSSVAKFAATGYAVNERFPFYSRSAFDTDEGYLDVQRAGTDLIREIAQLDPPAAAPDCYWSTLADDVEIGDFATEDLLARVLPSGE